MLDFLKDIAKARTSSLASSRIYATAQSPGATHQAADRNNERFLSFGEITILVHAADFGKQTIMEYTAPAGFSRVPLHRHNKMTEWFYVLQGAMHLNVAAQANRLLPGEFITIERGTPHHWKNASASETLRFMFGFSRPGMHRYFAEMFDLLKKFPAESTELRHGMKALAMRYDSVNV
jgi:quercetin dioxygenase-like cupin family protein